MKQKLIAVMVAVVIVAGGVGAEEIRLANGSVIDAVVKRQDTDGLVLVPVGKQAVKYRWDQLAPGMLEELKARRAEAAKVAAEAGKTMKARVQQTMPRGGGLLVELYEMAVIPGSSAQPVATSMGVMMKSPTASQPSGKLAIITGYDRTVADGAVISFRAVPGEVVTHVDTEGVEHRFESFAYKGEAE